MGVIHGGESIDAFAEALQNALEAAKIGGEAAAIAAADTALPRSYDPI